MRWSKQIIILGALLLPTVGYARTQLEAEYDFSVAWFLAARSRFTEVVTVPASEIIRRTFMANQDDPRMPAILDNADWSIWLGENDATPDQAKAVLCTVEGVSWKMAPEPKKPKT